MTASNACLMTAQEISNNKKKDEEKYCIQYKKIKQAYNATYISDTGGIASETQTGCILSLYFDLAEEKRRPILQKALQANIENHENHLTTGFVGTPYLCHVLSEIGLYELAGTIFLKEDYPSWLYAVKKGATTVWERWDSIMPNGDFNPSGMNSLNHYAYGCIGDWMYRKLAGINQLEPGYRKILIRPQIIKGITSVESVFKSVYGTIKSAWSYANKMVKIDIEIPANTTAIIYIPGQANPVEVGSGCYHFENETDATIFLN